MRRFLHLLTYFAFRLCLALIWIVPINLVFIAGFCGGEIAYWVLRRRRRLSLVNLTRAFKGRKDDAELRALNRRHFRRLAANLLCCFKIETMSHGEILKRIIIEKPPTLEVPPEGKRTGWVAMISHLSNWELFGSATTLFPTYKFGAVYQKIANPFIDRHLRKMRAQAEVVLFERREGFLRCIEFLRQGGVVGVLVDQSAGYAGLWTPLFNRLASCSTLAASLAIRTNVPIVPIAIYTRGIARWSIVASEPLESGDDDIDAFTARINRQLEKQIEQSPADWLWAHNRWKPLRPHFLLARDQRRYFLPPASEGRDLDPFRVLFESPPTLPEAEASLAAVRAIKNGRPDLFLAVVAKPPLMDFWRSVTEVDKVVERKESISSIQSNIRSIRDFDAAIATTASFWPALEFCLAGIPIRVGARKIPSRWLHNQYLTKLEAQADEPALVYLRIAQSVGANINMELAASFPNASIV